MKEPGFEHFVPQYKSIKASLDAYKLDTLKPVTTDGMRGIWYYGPPGSGKSREARERSLKQYGEEPYIMTGAKWLDGYQGHKVIIIEDLDKYTCHGLAHFLKLWGDRYPVTAEVKGSTVPLMHEILIVTSNYTIAELYAPDEERHTNQ